MGTSQLATAGAVTLVFTGLARLVRGVSWSGAIAGAVVCFVLFAAAGLGAFAALVAVFALTWLGTRLGYRRKQKLGTAQNRDGRGAAQVLANLAVAAACAGLAWFSARPAFLVAMVAALAEAAADTVSSEIGQARGESARLITTWEIVPAGTDGGVTLWGTVAGLIAAVAISGVSSLFGLVSPRSIGISVTAALLGTIADSYLGAVFERKELLGNNWINFLGTLLAAGSALFLV